MFEREPQAVVKQRSHTSERVQGRPDGRVETVRAQQTQQAPGPSRELPRGQYRRPARVVEAGLGHQGGQVVVSLTVFAQEHEGKHGAHRPSRVHAHLHPHLRPDDGTHTGLFAGAGEADDSAQVELVCQGERGETQLRRPLRQVLGIRCPVQERESGPGREFDEPEIVPGIA